MYLRHPLKSTSKKQGDPAEIVIDEWVGQYIPLLGSMGVQNWWVPALAFVLFRFFDIAKPFPVRSVERFHGALGVMCDDMAAGILAAICLHGILLISA